VVQNNELFIDTAMANDKPVVAFDFGANKEAIVSGENGCLLYGENMEQLAFHVASLLKDEKLAIRMVQKAGRELQKCSH
jgi:hypothetical protein